MGNIEMEIRTSSMSKATAEKTKEFIVEAFKEYKIEKDIAQHVKTAMDELEGGTWHCIVGANFGSSISFSAKHCLFLRISTTKSKKLTSRAKPTRWFSNLRSETKQQHLYLCYDSHINSSPSHQHVCQETHSWVDRSVDIAQHARREVDVFVLREVDVFRMVCCMMCTQNYKE